MHSFNHPALLFLLVVSLGLATRAFTAPAPSAADPTRVSIAEQDLDRDGIPDLFDLCPGAPNTGLPDSDGDGTRDACDLDPDNDGRLHVVHEGRVWLMGSAR